MNEPEETPNNEVEEVTEDEGNNADTFRDHDPVERIHRDYEIWDRFYR